jgi:hypothetical protein
LDVKPYFLQGKVCFHELGVQLSYQQEVFLHDNADCGAEGMGDKAVLELGVSVHKFLDDIVILAEWEHLAHKEL